MSAATIDRAAQRRLYDIKAAEAAGREVGARLAQTPLSVEQRAVVVRVLGGGR